MSSPALAGNIVVLSTVAYAAALNALNADAYYLSVQEDESLEWATFWAFSLAAVLNGRQAAVRRRRGEAPWFSLGVCLFCFFVAMEEISWAQRVFGYRPPAYFLERNFQQELNLHNVVGSFWRKVALGAVILGYGAVLPGVARWGAASRRLAPLGMVAPPASLLPAFLTTFATYVVYPWDFTGEWVELMLGLCFLCAVPLQVPAQRTRTIALACLTVAALGVGTAMAYRLHRDTDGHNLALAQVEVSALKRDFDSGRLFVDCDIHKRLYTYRQTYRQDYLLEGSFAGLTAGGLPEARARFLLDPWSSPYWIRDTCSPESRVTLVYSFGPNRRRDSTESEILGDDVGVRLQLPQVRWRTAQGKR
jgi:hypothetical protein